MAATKPANKGEVVSEGVGDGRSFYLEILRAVRYYLGRKEGLSPEDYSQNSVRSTSRAINGKVEEEPPRCLTVDTARFRIESGYMSIIALSVRGLPSTGCLNSEELKLTIAGLGMWPIHDDEWGENRQWKK